MDEIMDEISIQIGDIPIIEASIDATIVTYAGGGTSCHSHLTERSLPNQHPIAAITGLSEALENTVSTEELQDAVENALTIAKESGEFKGEKGEKGEKGADGYTPVKGTDYWTEADKAEILENILSGGEEVPSYWLKALEAGAQEINEKLCIAGSDKSAFLFYSDAHWNYGSQMSPTLLKYLYRHTGMTKTFFGGDIVNNEAADYDTMEYLWDWRNQLKNLPNHHSVVGNHDDGNATNNLFSEQYVYGYLLAAEETPDVVRGDSGLYYYIDSTPEKTRYIFLDTAFIGLNSAEQAFVKNALLTTPVGWHIVAVAHIWYDSNYDTTPPSVGELSGDGSILLAMFDAYNSRSGEYAACGGWVEFCIGGHTHIDHNGTSSTGIPIILVETDSRHVRSGSSFTFGTTTEASVNGIVADYSNHKIYICRIGRGESREVEITNYVVSYTNLLPLALDADGSSIYNGIGYKVDTRWSSSGNAESTATGIYLTGWIPCTIGDTVYLKNITMPFVDGNACLVHCFVNTFETATQNSGAVSGLDDWSPVLDENNNLIQFTVPTKVGSLTHIRIQCGNINAASVITVNEPIG